MTGKPGKTKGQLPTLPSSTASAKTRLVPKKTVDAIFDRCEWPDVGDKYAFIAHLIAELSRYPDDVLEMAVPVVARQYRRPAIADIVKVCDELYAPRRDQFTTREREREQLTERMLIEAFNTKNKPDPDWYARQQADLAARGMFIGKATRPNEKAEAMKLLREKYGMTDEMFDAIPNAGGNDAGSRGG